MNKNYTTMPLRYEPTQAMLRQAPSLMAPKHTPPLLHGVYQR